MHSHLLVAAVLATVNLVVSGQGNFAFYKLSLQWPPSVCNDPRFDCGGSTILSSFTIHGLWPQFYDDSPVPPYDPINNRCTDVIPTNPDDILYSLQSLQEPYLTGFWPNLRNPQSLSTNQWFWKLEWQRHGMCSDYSNDPYQYFVAAINLFVNYEPLYGTGIEPREDPYPAYTISEAIRGKVGAYPEIACNQVDGILQLKEVRLCFLRETPPSPIIDCPKRYSIRCKSDDDLVRFTPPY
ncbi:hypothetical protein CRYUN_Cryun05aG0119700 [Craigia yunnanensis]